MKTAIHLMMGICLCLTTIEGTAQGKEEKLRRHDIGVMLGANSQQAFELEGSYSYMLNRYLGIVGGFNTMKQIDNASSFEGGDYFQWIPRQNKAIAILFHPAVRFRIPILKDQAKKDCLVFDIEPGAYLNLISNETVYFDYMNLYRSYLPSTDTRTVKNTGGEACTFQIRGVLSIILDKYRLSIGGSYSNFDIYSGRRNIRIPESGMWSDLFWSKRPTVTGFVSIGFLL